MQNWCGFLTRRGTSVIRFRSLRPAETRPRLTLDATRNLITILRSRIDLALQQRWRQGLKIVLAPPRVWSIDCGFSSQRVNWGGKGKTSSAGLANELHKWEMVPGVVFQAHYLAPNKNEIEYVSSLLHLEKLSSKQAWYVMCHQANPQEIAGWLWSDPTPQLQDPRSDLLSQPIGQVTWHPIVLPSQIRPGGMIGQSFIFSIFKQILLLSLFQRFLVTRIVPSGVSI